MMRRDSDALVAIAACQRGADFATMIWAADLLGESCIVTRAWLGRPQLCSARRSAIGIKPESVAMTSH